MLPDSSLAINKTKIDRKCNILSEQKFIKNAKNGLILASFWKPKACDETVLPDRSLFKRQKLVENAIPNETFWLAKKFIELPSMVHFGKFYENLKLAVKQCYQISHFLTEKKIKCNIEWTRVH